MRKWLLGVASGVFAIGAAEVILTILGFSFSFAPERVEFGWPDPQILAERYVPDPDLFWVLPDYEARLAALRAEPPDIIFAGDSTTEMGTYPSEFVVLANATADFAPIRGEKVGVSGWSSYQGLQQLERDVAPIGPRFVTLLFGWNDHWIGFGVEDADIHTITRSPLAHISGLRVGQLLMKAHYAWVAPAGPVDRRVPTDDFEDNLRAMIATARAAGIVPVLVTAPTSHEVGHEPPYLGDRWLRDLSDLVRLHRSYSLIVRNIAREQRAPLCDVAGDFAELPPRHLRDAYFLSDGIHLSPLGDKRLAGFLIDCFRGHADLNTLWKPAS